MSRDTRPAQAAIGGFDALHPVIQHHVVNTLHWPALRPLQEAAVEPILRGDDALLLAPTAGGKTEAAVFPLLTRMAQEGWAGTSVLYLCPLKALLNNAAPRVSSYAGWLGRSVALRHGDIGAAARRRQVIERPDILLTTPESLESLLVSAIYDPHELLRAVYAVVVDEVHAFAGDDRGWHLLAVLERVAQLAGRPLQRVGASATVGNAADLLGWLQGGNRRAGVAASVIAPDAGAAPPTDVGVDYVGNVANAATVISRLNLGEKRLVFGDSRRRVEQLAVELREREVETFVSHSSLSLDERRRAETAFAEGRDCVIVATSTLELGIDVGDLDRVLQIAAPWSVASFLQRLGRTGRRPGATRNMLFLETDDETLLRAVALLLLWSEGYVEPIVAPARPLHIVAQQVLAHVLQRRQATREDVWAVLAPLGMASRGDFDGIVDHLVGLGYLDVDSGLLFIGLEADRRFGRRHFLELMAVFLAAPEMVVLHGREEIGSVDPLALTQRREGPTVLALGGRSWKVTGVDWGRRRVHAEPTTGGGRSLWSGAPNAWSPELAGAMRRVLQGDSPAGVALTRRATRHLSFLRGEWADRVDCPDPILTEDRGRCLWWTWAGLRANLRYSSAMRAVAPELLSDELACDNLAVVLVEGVTAWQVAAALRAARDRFGPDLSGVEVFVNDAALRGLKFTELLPIELARDVLRRR